MKFPALILGFVLLSSVCGLAPTGGPALRDANSIYADGKSAPVAVLRIDRLATEYEKRGLFRIGLLPKAVFTGVSGDLDSVERLPAALGSLQRLIERSRREPSWELRLVRVSVRSGPAHLLAIGRGAKTKKKAQ